MKELPFVSVIVPCRNENQFIHKCLDSILQNDYPVDNFEILIIDGKSEDGTREILRKYAQKFSHIKILDNPKKITPCALNIGIQNARGDYILWLSAHNTYDKEYIPRCVSYFDRYETDAVGGTITTVPREQTHLGDVISTVSSHPFGVGNSTHKTGSNKPIWADTAFGVCYKRNVFDKIGLFNENLVRGQDMEFSLRLKKAGLKTLLAPDLNSQYYIRSDFKTFWTHSFKNGVWAILPFMHSQVIPVAWRHLVPLVFVSSLIFSGVFSLFFPFFFWFLIALFGSYALLDIFFSMKIFLDKKKPKFLFLSPLVFFSFHISYGLGSFLGVIKLFGSKPFWEKYFSSRKRRKTSLL